MRSRGPIIGYLNRKLQSDAVFGKWRRFRFSGSIAGYRGRYTRFEQSPCRPFIPPTSSATSRRR
jgi:hypothetical protein